MTRKIFEYAFFVGITALLLCALMFFGLQYTKSRDETYAALQQEAVYASRGLAIGGEDYLESLGSANRITWIDETGEVLYDNLFHGSVPNQSDCAEVAAAMKDGEGQGIRKSDSSGKETMYYALRCEDGTVLRLSRPLSALRTALMAVSPVLWVFVLILMISGVLAFRAAQQIVRPVNALNLDHPEQSAAYPELAPLVSRIQEQKLTIQEQMDELNRRQKELAVLTDSMSEGFVLLDRGGVVLSANRSALRLIPGSEIGEALLPKLQGTAHQAVAQALAGKRFEGVFQTDGQSWEWIANPVSGGGVGGAVLLMMDVTEREQRERLRQEFSANVSHELKTPLTSISGFAELIMQGLASGEKAQEFAGDIYRESQRLITLIGDIIKLSRLDEEGFEPKFETVDLRRLAEETVESLRPVARQKQVSLELTGETQRVRGVWRLLGEMLYNLCENAIKYNRPGGSVTVELSGGEEICLAVRDTGVGIPYASQKRVFERFYRVDKSHSKEIGGTGLGLSIVKHGAQLHRARLELESEPGVGTCIRLFFPRPEQETENA